MIKCSKCNTLYSESAKLCLYCKVPLEVSNNFDETLFTFKIKEFTSETEAQNFKTSLLATEIPCAIRIEENKYNVYIPEDAKKSAFKPNHTSILEANLGSSNSKDKNKSSYYVAFIFIILIGCFIFYFKQFRSKMLLESQKIDYKVVTEGGSVDPRIIDIKSKNISPKEKKKEGKQKVENQTPH